jgi:hypothetical protein
MRRWLGLTLLLIIIVVCLTLIFIGRTLATQQLQTMLQSALGQKTELTLSEIGLHHSAVDNIRIGSDTPLIIPQLTLDYTAQELWQGRLNHLSVHDIHLTISKTPQGWVLPGIIPTTPSPTDKNTAISLPFTTDAVEAIPLGATTIKNSSLHMTTPTWQLNCPFDLHWQQKPTAQIQAESSGIQFSVGAYGLNSQDLAFTAQHDSAQSEWQGTWSAKNLTIKGAGDIIPALQAQGTLSIKADQAILKGTLQNTDKTWQANFTLRQAPPMSDALQLQLHHLTIPQLGGQITVDNQTIPLDGHSTINLELQIHKIALASLLQQLTNQTASGTGTVSGIIPITLYPNGEFSIANGTLEADTAGTIALAPSAIPGDQPQLVLVRDILQDLHYQHLTLTIASDRARKIALQFALEGNNPAVQAGKPVKLNVNLNGAVLDFIQQNLQILTDPKQLLPTGHHDKK